MAKGISSYKGVWKSEETAVVVSPPETERAASTERVASTPPAPETVQAPPELPAALLEHRYRLLVLRDHRQKLGRDLLESAKSRPWHMAWTAVTSLGKSYRPWAHGRFFAIGCYLGVEMSPEILRQLRHPLQFGRYRRSMFGLWRLLEMLAQKSGQKPALGWAFRLCCGFPPLAMLIYEKQLQVLLANAQGLSEARVLATTQGQ